MWSTKRQTSQDCFPNLSSGFSAVFHLEPYIWLHVIGTTKSRVARAIFLSVAEDNLVPCLFSVAWRPAATSALSGKSTEATVPSTRAASRTPSSVSMQGDVNDRPNSGAPGRGGGGAKSVADSFEAFLKTQSQSPCAAVLLCIALTRPLGPSLEEALRRADLGPKTAARFAFLNAWYFCNKLPLQRLGKSWRRATCSKTNSKHPTRSTHRFWNSGKS